jgi:hypothetical protein
LILADELTLLYGQSSKASVACINFCPLSSRATKVLVHETNHF